ncbi:MAG: hypothetical protein A2X59_03815 [Nitrospirae bacterium GWC2_42_7]|nr:MAG: hypothetical protein A2X59_03815 [Nitrospirae bacterium GWC2_42_7]
MIPVRSLTEVIERLRDQFRYEDPHKRTKLLGILFCRPQLKAAKDEVIPHLNYFHVRSGPHVDFFFAGFHRIQDHISDGPFAYEVDGVDGEKWIFDEREFNRWRYELEQASKWRYSGGNDLVLANARYDDEHREPYIDLGHAVCMNLEEAQQSGASPELSMILEGIFRYAESPDLKDPVWGLSDESGKRIGGNALRKLFVSILPEALRGSAEHAFHYAVRDIGRSDYRDRRSDFEDHEMSSKGRLYHIR